MGEGSGGGATGRGVGKRGGDVQIMRKIILGPTLFFFLL